jgi:hypothetical protein
MFHASIETVCCLLSEIVMYRAVSRCPAVLKIAYVVQGIRNVCVQRPGRCFSRFSLPSRRESGGFKYHAIILLAVQLYYPPCKLVCCCVVDRSDSVRQEPGLRLGRQLSGN